MIERNARFYFANLLADVARCVGAREAHNELRYQDSLARAHKTLGLLRKAGRPEAYEEGILLCRALDLSGDDIIYGFKKNLSALSLQFAPRKGYNFRAHMV